MHRQNTTHQKKSFVLFLIPVILFVLLAFSAYANQKKKQADADQSHQKNYGESQHPNSEGKSKKNKGTERPKQSKRYPELEVDPD